MQRIDAEKEGLFYGYVIVGIAFLINLITGGALYTFSVFFKPLSSDFGWTRALTSGAFSLYMFLHGFLFILTGRLNDRFGPRVVVSGCGFFVGLGYLLMSQVSEIWHVYLFFGVIIGIGMSGGYVPITSTVTRWFETHTKRSLMVGISVAGLGIGTMIVPPLANWLIISYGWRTSYTIIGITILVLIMVGAQFLKRTPGPNRQTGTNGAFVEVAGLSIGQAIRTRQFWLLCMAYFGFGLFLQAIMVHIVLHALGLGISSRAAANLFIAIGGFGVVGRIVMGFIGDKKGNNLSMMIGFALMVTAFFWLLISNELWMLLLFSCIFGFAYGGLVATESLIIADLFGIRSHGVILGLITSALTVGCAAGPVMAGAIHDATKSYYPAFWVCIAFSVIGLVLAVLLNPIARVSEK